MPDDRERVWPPAGWIVKAMGVPLIPIEDGEALWEFFDREQFPELFAAADARSARDYSNPSSG